MRSLASGLPVLLVLFAAKMLFTLDEGFFFWNEGTALATLQHVFRLWWCFIRCASFLIEQAPYQKINDNKNSENNQTTEHFTF